MTAIECESLEHTYVVDDVEVRAVRGVDLVVEDGDTVALLGTSGSGKSTLLAMCAALLRPTGGRLAVAGSDVGEMTEREALALRAAHLGVVLQSPGRNLLGYATALENLLFAQRAGGVSRRERRARAEELLDEVGLADGGHKPIAALSGGEQQRLAVAMSLSNRPRLLLADEPTSQLDDANGRRVVELLSAARDRHGATVVVVTHDPDVAAAMDRTVHLRDGRLIGEEWA